MKSLLIKMADKFDMESDVLLSTLRQTVMPKGASNEQLAAFLMIASKYDLNPIAKEIHAFPSSGGGIQPVVGIDGWMNLAQRRQEFDGIEFDYGDGYVTCRVFRKDRSHPVEITEFMEECSRNTAPWKSHPRRMLRHKAAIQAIRYAFGFSGIKDEDDIDPLEPRVEKDVTPARTVAKLKRIDPEQQQQQAPKWPVEIDGVWTDARGMAFNDQIHGISNTGVPGVTRAGHFRMRRGCDPQVHASLEQEALNPAIEPEPEPVVEPEPVQQSSQPYIDTLNMITEAGTLERLSEVEELLIGWEGAEDELFRLEDVFVKRREAIEEQKHEK